MTSKNGNAVGKIIHRFRCAVYTRKSSEDGLEQEFNSLDAQREAGEAYIKSQASEGWECLPDEYDDGGFTGGNMDRPAVQRLMADIEAGRVDCVVVYKVDRLSRSLLDFARMLEAFERHNVSFVSVTQQFNTATSMGRLILNVLLSFAQFEREMISERTRDKIAATRRKGKWSGGMPLLGYDVVDTKLVVDPGEAEKVRAIFELYLERELAGHHRAMQSLVRSPSTGQDDGLATARFADLQDRIASTERRLTEVRDQAERVRRDLIDEAEAAHAMAEFDPVWESLSPREQGRLLQLLIERVDYDGHDGMVSITFHAGGIKALANHEFAGDAA